MKRIVTACLFLLIAYHGSARAEEMESKGTTDYCSMIDRNMIILGLTNPANCALGTGHVLGISKDKVILDGLFGLEVQLGMGNRDVTIEREHGKKNPLSLMLKFNRHNVFLGFKLRW